MKFESAKDTGIALAEIEFHSTVGKLTGRPFGTSVFKGSSTSFENTLTFEKALDGDPNTWFEAVIDQAYVGIDPVPSHRPTPHF